MFNAIKKGFGFIMGVILGIGIAGGTIFIAAANNNKLMLHLGKNDPKMFEVLKAFRL
jgi:hypothetical protein